jgi:2-oxoglutarate ferredoxin oxidoreductase subunit beta
MNAVAESDFILKPGDYKSGISPIWCAGCGDYAVLNAIYRAMADLQLKPWETAVISGIGCSSRLPGYVSAYGLNGLHGRALPVALGIKAANPKIRVIAVGGDGDGLSIGPGHFFHAARRNADVTYVMMDNEIYGLTKGQAAPTTPKGDKTKSTVYGNPEEPIDPCEMAISFGATFVGRGFSGDLKTLVPLLVEALNHKGFAFVCVISPCVTFRGDEQYKTLKPLVTPIPADHDATDRVAAMHYTREQRKLSVGVLYRVSRSTMLDGQQYVRQQAVAKHPKPPAMAELQRLFLP